jgi:hypothetical protein
VREIPALFERYWTIEEYDGNEHVHVDINEAYADALHLFMESGDSGRLCDQYRAIKSAAGRLLGTSEIGLREEEVATAAATTADADAAHSPPILKRPSIVGEEEAAIPDDYAKVVGYSYFGIGDGDEPHAGAGHT